MRALTHTELGQYDRATKATRSGSSSLVGEAAVGGLEAADRDGVAGEEGLAAVLDAGPRGSGRSRPCRPRRPPRSEVTSTVRSSRRWRGGGQQVGLDRGQQVGDPVRRPRRRAPVRFSPVSRRTRVTRPSARSRGPTSIRTGTPLSSQSVARRPKLVATWASSRTCTPAAFSSAASAAAASPAPSSSRTSSTTAWIGREPGGITQAGVVAVGHDQPADHAGGHAPRRRPAELRCRRWRRGR